MMLYDFVYTFLRFYDVAATGTVPATGCGSTARMGAKLSHVTASCLQPWNV